jgi:hypothetical protein
LLETQTEKQKKEENEYSYKRFIAWRHNLSYAKLFHNHDGGYSMERLTTIM